MKTRQPCPLQVLTLMLIASVCFSPSLAPAYSGGPDASYTGAPGEPTCLACHTPPVARAGSVVLSGVPPAYNPGVTYPLTVTVNDTGSRFGFELTAINDSGTQAGTLITNANVQYRTFTTNSLGNTRQYIGHTFGSSGGNSWSFDWTAPSSAVSPVRFYVAALRGDNLFTTTSDTVYTNLVTSLDHLRVAIARSGTNVVLSWTGGTLQYVDKLPATIWTNVPGNPVSPYTTNTLQARRFYRTTLP